MRISPREANSMLSAIASSGIFLRTRGQIAGKDRYQTRKPPRGGFRVDTTRLIKDCPNRVVCCQVDCAGVRSCRTRNHRIRSYTVGTPAAEADPWYSGRSNGDTGSDGISCCTHRCAEPGGNRSGTTVDHIRGPCCRRSRYEPTGRV